MSAPAPHSDAMIRRLEGEIEERNQLIQGLAQDAQSANNGAGRDLSESEREQITRARDRISELVTQLDPLRESSRIALEARQRTEVINAEIDRMRGRGGTLPGDVEYRSAATYIADVWSSQMGDRDAHNRLESFNRTAAHQTTADNAGLLPESIVEPVLNFVDNTRPLVSAIGTTDLGTGSWAYAKVTQHTQVDVQSAEKAEMASRKMLITKTSITAPTYGGYVNVSKQDINRTSPQILDMVIADLAGEYAIETEQAAVADLLAGATAGTAIDASPTQAEVSTALWAAAATAYSNVRGGGRLILAVHPTDFALFGPLFAPVNPSNAISTGFNAGEFGSGVMGSISGIQVVMSPGFAAAGQALVINTRGVRLFEARYGALQVNEPSVWGVQVGYAGDFETAIVQTGSIISIDTAP